MLFTEHTLCRPVYSVTQTGLISCLLLPGHQIVIIIVLLLHMMYLHNNDFFPSDWLVWMETYVYQFSKQRKYAFLYMMRKNNQIWFTTKVWHPELKVCLFGAFFEHKLSTGLQFLHFEKYEKEKVFALLPKTSISNLLDSVTLLFLKSNILLYHRMLADSRGRWWDYFIFNIPPWFQREDSTCRKHMGMSFQQWLLFFFFSYWRGGRV